jgi:hypothetical protein
MFPHTFNHKTFQMQLSPVNKKYFIGLILFSSLSFASPYAAQSILGKWNQVIARQYLTDEAAKTVGKPYVETDMSTIGTVVYDFKSDKTYEMTSVSSLDGDKRESKGIWSLARSELTMSTVTGGQSVKSTVSFQSGDLIIETLHPESKKTRKVVLTFKKV